MPTYRITFKRVSAFAVAALALGTNEAFSWSLRDIPISGPSPPPSSPLGLKEARVQDSHSLKKQQQLQQRTPPLASVPSQWLLTSSLFLAVTAFGLSCYSVPAFAEDLTVSPATHTTILLESDIARLETPKVAAEPPLPPAAEPPAAEPPAAEPPAAETPATETPAIDSVVASTTTSAAEESSPLHHATEDLLLEEATTTTIAPSLSSDDGTSIKTKSAESPSDTYLAAKDEIESSSKDSASSYEHVNAEVKTSTTEVKTQEPSNTIAADASGKVLAETKPPSKIDCASITTDAQCSPHPSQTAKVESSAQSDDAVQTLVSPLTADKEGSTTAVSTTSTAESLASLAEESKTSGKEHVAIEEERMLEEQEFKSHDLSKEQIKWLRKH